MNESTALLTFAAWLGAVLDQSRRQQLPFPLDHEAFLRDQLSFGFSPAAYTPLASSPHAPRPCPRELVPLFRAIHSALRGTPHEANSWFNLLNAPVCPPEDLLEDLIARDIHVGQIGHLPLSDRLLWKLADQVPEALLTLGKRRFLDPTCPPERLEEVLHAYPNHQWLLRSLSELAEDASEKSQIVARYIAADAAHRNRAE